MPCLSHDFLVMVNQHTVQLPNCDGRLILPEDPLKSEAIAELNAMIHLQLNARPFPRPHIELAPGSVGSSLGYPGHRRKLRLSIRAFHVRGAWIKNRVPLKVDYESGKLTSAPGFTARTISSRVVLSPCKQHEMSKPYNAA